MNRLLSALLHSSCYRSVVAGDHRPGSALFHLTSPDRVARVLVERLPLSVVTHSQLRRKSFVSMLGTVSVALCLIGDSKTTQITMPALVISQAPPVQQLHRFYAVVWLRFRIKIARQPLCFFPCHRTFALSRDAEVRTDISNIVRNAGNYFGLFGCPSRSLRTRVRVAASVAPIGAVVGEWVGSSSGLGYLMMHANGRGQTDLMFAALIVLCVEALFIWSLVNRLANRFDQNSHFAD